MFYIYAGLSAGLLALCAILLSGNPHAQFLENVGKNRPKLAINYSHNCAFLLNDSGGGLEQPVGPYPINRPGLSCTLWSFFWKASSGLRSLSLIKMKKKEARQEDNGL